MRIKRFIGLFFFDLFTVRNGQTIEEEKHEKEN